jgi:hypothetical protein
MFVKNLSKGQVGLGWSWKNLRDAATYDTLKTFKAMYESKNFQLSGCELDESINTRRFDISDYCIKTLGMTPTFTTVYYVVQTGNVEGLKYIYERFPELVKECPNIYEKALCNSRESVIGFLENIGYTNLENIDIISCSRLELSKFKTLLSGLSDQIAADAVAKISTDSLVYLQNDHFKFVFELILKHKLNTSYFTKDLFNQAVMFDKIDIITFLCEQPFQTITLDHVKLALNCQANKFLSFVIASRKIDLAYLAQSLKENLPLIIETDNVLCLKTVYHSTQNKNIFIDILFTSISTLSVKCNMFLITELKHEGFELDFKLLAKNCDITSIHLVYDNAPNKQDFLDNIDPSNFELFYLVPHFNLDHPKNRPLIYCDCRNHYSLQKMVERKVKELKNLKNITTYSLSVKNDFNLDLVKYCICPYL